MEIVYFVVGFGVSLMVSLDREWLGFVRRGVSNGFGRDFGIFGWCRSGFCCV